MCPVVVDLFCDDLKYIFWDHSGEGGLVVGIYSLGVRGCLCQCNITSAALCLSITGLGLVFLRCLDRVLYLCCCFCRLCGSAWASRSRYRLTTRLCGVIVILLGVVIETETRDFF